MAEKILENTLPPLPRTDVSATLTGDRDKDIKSLEKGAGNMEAMASVMRGIGTREYDRRQKADLELAGKQFDPTEVSGGTFSSIIGNLEQRRGTDVSKTYGAGMTAFEKQEARKERLASELRAEREAEKERERQNKIRKEEFDKELKDQAMLMGVTDLSGSSEDIRLRIASKVKAKEKAAKDAASSIWGATETEKNIDSQVEDFLKSLGVTEETAATQEGTQDAPVEEASFYGPELPEPVYYGPKLESAYYGPNLPQ